MTIDKMMSNMPINEKKSFDDFFTEFWSSCQCSSKCPFKVDIKVAFEIYKLNQTSEKNILKECLDEISHDKRQVFNYHISGAKICKNFFLMAHNITRRELERIQKCLKMNDEFKYKSKNNNLLSIDVLESLRIYLSNKINSWKMPNPSSAGPEYYLPCNFNWKAAYSEFCNEYKKNFTSDKVPISWSSFFKFYSEEFDSLKKLSKKTDYCDFCSKTHLNLLNDLPLEERVRIKVNLETHLEKAKRARDSYNSIRNSSVNLQDTKVISFDYSENILLPHLMEEPSIFYFKSRRKYDLFGICDENTTWMNVSKFRRAAQTL